MIARHIEISGLVQGVGFRPFVCRLAKQIPLTGWVRNYGEGLEVFIQGRQDQIDKFQNTLLMEPPPGADIYEIKSEPRESQSLNNFSIKPSRNGSRVDTNISPDLAICEPCLKDIYSQPRRYHHLFTSCTHCGPRFSIVEGIPYDRINTTMRGFEMCSECEKEYRNETDRRFHAQPIACLSCGPSYTWYEGDIIITDQQEIPEILRQNLEKGNVIAVKGIGGYHLLCDAFNNKSVRRIRMIKRRDNKPFAVMFKDLPTTREFAFIDEAEEKLLLSPQSPIVIVKSRKPLPPEINSGLSSIGILLPYMPLHFLLMKELSIPAIVCTSANQSGDPIISKEGEAIDKLRLVCDGILTNNREIKNKQDDSVLHIVADQPSFLRRSRGYVPQPILMRNSVDGFLALGADMKNCFCIGKKNKAILSQYIGDLDNYDTNLHYRKTIGNYLNLFGVKPRIIVCDAHPGYYSSQYAEQLMKDNQILQIMKVQHHHAHIASVMAEHNLDEEVIGISMDGTGYGEDTKIWGSEFMTCSLNDYHRVLHMEYLKLPGGDLAIKEPWRIAIACLYSVFGNDYHQEITIPVAMDRQKIVIRSIENNLNTVESCGMGRLFDAVAALLNVCLNADYDGEGPMKLEDLTLSESKGTYPYSIDKEIFKISEIIKGIVKDLNDGVSVNEISTRFHNTITSLIIDGIEKIADKTGLQKVVLSGGSFQNRYMTNRLIKHLEKKCFKVYLNRKVPTNDGGLALGQIAIAMKRLSQNKEFNNVPKCTSRNN